MSIRTYGFTMVAAALAIATGCGGGSPSGGASSAPDPNKAEVSPPGDIPDNQAFVRYSPPGGGYSVEVPEGWGRTTPGKAVVFTDKLNSVQMQATPAGSASSASQVGAAVKADEASAAGFQLVRVAPVKRTAGTGVRADYLVTGKPDPVTGKARRLAVERYVFFHNGKAVTLTLSGAKGADNVDPWRRVTDSLRWSP
jgi:hypothetical protein